MAIDATLEKNCNLFLTDLLAQLRTAQEGYAAAVVDAREGKRRGVYWQGLRTPVNPPTKTVKREPDLSLTAGGHEETSWATLGVTMPTTVPCAVEVHTYDGPNGKGWVLVATVVESGVTYRRIINGEGAETWRSSDGWQRLMPATVGI